MPAVMVFDQPLFALANFVQWSWPEVFGESKFIVMFGGLHINGFMENYWRFSGGLRLDCCPDRS